MNICIVHGIHLIYAAINIYGYKHMAIFDIHGYICVQGCFSTTDMQNFFYDIFL